MSVRLMSLVFADRALGPMEKLILLAMADHARDDGSGFYRSVGTLAEKCSLDRRTIQRVMARLERGGLIRATGQHHGRGKAVEYSVEIGTKGGTAPLFLVHKGRQPGAKGAALVREKGGVAPPESSITIQEPSLLDFSKVEISAPDAVGESVENPAQDLSPPPSPDRKTEERIAAGAVVPAARAPYQLPPRRADFERAIFRRAVSSALHDTWLRSRSDDRQACVDGLNLAVRAAADSLVENRHASLTGVAAAAVVASASRRIGRRVDAMFAVADFTRRIEAATGAVVSVVADTAIELLAGSITGAGDEATESAPGCAALRRERRTHERCREEAIGRHGPR